MLIFPTQARDKHRESTQTKAVFPQDGGGAGRPSVFLRARLHRDNERETRKETNVDETRERGRSARAPHGGARNG